jgi:hypothetical protein
MFAELPPGAKLNPHRDPFAGSMRYHLGLATPNDDRCFIEVDGERHSWRDGEGVIFDETYIHWADQRQRERPHDPVLRRRAPDALPLDVGDQPLARPHHDDGRRLAQRDRRPDRPGQQAVPHFARDGPVPPPLQGLEQDGLQGHQGRADRRPGCAGLLHLSTNPSMKKGRWKAALLLRPRSR